MNPHPVIRRTLLLAVSAFLLVALALPAAAAEEGAVPAKHGPAHVLAVVALVILFMIGSGCLLLLLRVMFPGPAHKADAAIRRLTTGRLLLTGLLPTVGAGLLGAAAGATGVQALLIVWCVVILLPALLLMLVGAMAAVPYLGAGLLKGGEERSLLTRTLLGAVVLGLALGASAALGPLVHFVGMLVAGWFLGAGLGIVFKPREPETASD